MQLVDKLNHGKQQGAVIVITLVILLVITTMGMTLVQVTNKESKQVVVVVNRSESLFSSESCIEDVIRWMEIEGLQGPPCEDVAEGVLCHSEPATATTMDQWSITGESSKNRARMQQYSYQCDLYLLTSVDSSGSGELGVGFDVGQTSAYGTPVVSTKYIYKIISSSTGAESTSANIEVIASMVF